MELRIRLHPDDPYKPLTYVFNGISELIWIGFKWGFSGIPFGDCLRHLFV